MLIADARATFDEMDENKDNAVDIGEVNRALIKLGITLKPNELQRYFRNTDTDGRSRDTYIFIHESSLSSEPKYKRMIKNLFHKKLISKENNLKVYAEVDHNCLYLPKRGIGLKHMLFAL